MMTTAFGAAKPTYQVILELDRKIRDFAVTNKMKTRCGEAEDPSITDDIHMNRWLGMSAKEASKSKSFGIVLLLITIQLLFICIGPISLKHWPKTPGIY